MFQELLFLETSLKEERLWLFKGIFKGFFNHWGRFFKGVGQFGVPTFGGLVEFKAFLANFGRIELF